MKRKISLLFGIIILSMTMLAGCGHKEVKDEQGKVNENSSVEVDGKSETITVIDFAHREVVLEKAERVVVLGSAARLYTYLAGTERLVGVERKKQLIESGRPFIVANPELADLPLVGEGFPGPIDLELLIESEADVIIAGNKDMKEIEEIEKKTGIPVVIVSVGDSTIFHEDIDKSLRIIGEVIGKKERARELIEYMKACQSELENRTKGIPEDERLRVYVGALSYKGNHGIESTSSNSPVLNAVNANNVADEVGKVGSLIIDKEKLVEWDPEIIIIDENGLSLVREDYEKNPNYYNTLSAVKNGKVYGQLPYISSYNNIETAIADAYFIGKILYPEEFKDIDVIKKADEIYTFMLGKPLYKKMEERFGGYIKIDL